jgi:hypothetical protein
MSKLMNKEENGSGYLMYIFDTLLNKTKALEKNVT